MRYSKRLLKIMNVMSDGKPRRPHEFLKLKIKIATLESDVNLLESLGLLKRDVIKGLVWWSKL